jgi:hypothetical protein
VEARKKTEIVMGKRRKEAPDFSKFVTSTPSPLCTNNWHLLRAPVVHDTFSTTSLVFLPTKNFEIKN